MATAGNPDEGIFGQDSCPTFSVNHKEENLIVSCQPQNLSTKTKTNSVLEFHFALRAPLLAFPPSLSEE